MPATLAPPTDLDRYEILARLHRNGITIAMLARRNSVSSNNISVALDRPYPKAERIIADALGLKIEDIWPTRVARRRLRAAA